MRYLTIKRTKSFVACLVSMKVYIEDHSSSEISINNVPCRKLGIIKNGGESRFEIGDGAAKVFVIADKLSKNYCNEFYELPAGTDNIYLTGKNCFNPANGNAFRFDNNNSEAVVNNRKSNNMIGLVVLILAVIIGFIIGFAGAMM